MGTATIIVKFASLAKDFYVARQLGAGDSLDAYLVALLLPSYAVVTLAQTVSLALVPTYVRVWQSRGLAAAQRLAGGVLAAGIGLLLAVTAVLLLAAPFVLPLVGLGFDASKIALTRSLFYPMAGILLASGLSAVFGAVLEAHERFTAKAVAPLAIPLGMLAVYWLYQAHYGVHALAAGTLAGFAGETVILGLACWWRGLFAIPRWTKDPELPRVGGQYWPVVCGGLLLSSSLVVDQSMAASLASGQVSVLSYGGKVVAVAVTSVALSLATVLLPRFSHLIAAGRWQQFQRTFALYAGLVFTASIPCVVLLVVLSEPLVRLLFQRGAFTPETTEAVSRVQQWLLVQIPFHIVSLLGIRVLSAMGGNRMVLAIGA